MCWIYEQKHFVNKLYQFNICVIRNFDSKLINLIPVFLSFLMLSSPDAHGCSNILKTTSLTIILVDF